MAAIGNHNPAINRSAAVSKIEQRTFLIFLVLAIFVVASAVTSLGLGAFFRFGFPMMGYFVDGIRESGALNVPRMAHSGKVYEFKLQGEVFRVPETYLATILLESDLVPGELSSGFTMIGTAPEFSPKTAENISLFSGSGQTVVTVSVGRACYPKGIGNPSCVPSQIIEGQHLLYRTLRNNQLKRVDYSGFIPDGYVVSTAVYRPATPINPDDDYLEVLMQSGITGNDPRLLRCTFIGKQKHGACTVTFLLKNKYLIDVQFPSKFIGLISVIQQKAIDKIVFFTVDQTQPLPGAEIIRFPQVNR